MAKVKQQLWREPEHELEFIQANNMHISKMSSSKFVKQVDVDPAVLVTIAKFTQENVARETEPADMKWVMHFTDFEKPLVLNQTNIALAAFALSSEETDTWIGQKLVLFNDPSVMFGAERKGGVRIRAPKPSTPVATAIPAAQAIPFNDDIPF